MSVVQTFVGWGVTAYSLVVSTRGAGDSSASSNPEYSDAATRALASAGEGGGQMGSLAGSLAKVNVEDSRTSEGGTEREITNVNSDRQIEHDHTTPKDKSANKEPNSKRDPSTILAETELAPPNVESNLLQTDQVESSLTTASAREHKTTVDPTQQGAGIVQAETEPDDKSASKTSTPELPQEHASHIKSEPADDQSVSIKSIDDHQDIVASKDPKPDGNNEGRPENEKLAPCASPSTPTSSESGGTPKPEVKILPLDVDSSSSREEAGVPPTSTISGSQPQEPQSLPANQAIQTEDLQATSKQQHENTTKPIQSEHGGADPGQGEPDHVTPKAPRPVLPEVTEQGEDVDSLVGDLDRVKLDDSNDSEDAIQCKRAEEKEVQRSPKIITNHSGQVKSEVSNNRSVPSTPCDKGDQCRYYFCPWINWYYVDDSQNAYKEDGTLLHDALFAIHSDELGPYFPIDQIPYRFYNNRLVFQAPDGLLYPVQTRHEKSYFHTPSGVHYFDYRRNMFSMVTPGDVPVGTPVNSDGLSSYVYGPKAGNSHPIAPGDFKRFWPDSLGIDSGGLIPMTFCIGGAVYWFNMEVLWCQAPGDRSHRVHTWQTDPNESPADMKHYFRAPSGVYYFDYSRDVFSHDGILVCASSSAIDVGGLLPMTFCIGGTVYWFDVDVLWCQAPGDESRRVHTWQDDPNESLADRKHHFYTPGGLYYFDYRWNVFSHEGKVLRTSPSAMNLGGLLPATRCIDGIVYWFDMDELWCQASTDKCYRVHTWQSEPNQSLAGKKHHFYVSNILYYLDEHSNLYSEDGKLVCKSPLSLATNELGIPSFQIGATPFWVHKDGLLSRGDDDILCRVLAWPNDSCVSDGKSDSLQTGLLEGIVSWSPDCLALSSPSTGSTIDGCQMQGTPSLFLESQPGHIQSASITPVRHNTTEKVNIQPARKRGNKDHLKCPYCGKECRRPIALKEHIRAHEKDKSQLCPFVDPNTGFACDTGFCTKQNMRRHFSIHRAGTLEEFLGLPALIPRKKKGAASELFAPHNPYHQHPPPKKQ
ncbi:Histone-lysine N-methyltransferase SETD1B [Rhizoctonia solani]|uniref:Histone-lysine N-methyltransferase SETD1B n=1 Tax=Rhizoctonia solani TaxID=456999 RepID=A0A0K6G7W9_9AGAM|nr:Histone-lysine N-methyltransferase SETD1B [Rhizoctonia solani]